jgi:hypothetical protein
MIDMLLADDDDKPKIDASVIKEAEEAEEKEEKLADQRPFIQNVLPTNLVSNDANNALSISMNKNSFLQKFLGSPLDNDPLVEAVRNESSTSSILNILMEEMAEEAAFIKAWRNANWNGEVDLSEATSKRIKMLKDLVDTLVEREKLKKDKNVGKIDFYGDNFQRVLKYFLEVIQKTFKKVGIPAQFEDIFFTQLAKEFDGFEKAVEKTYYGKE